MSDSAIMTPPPPGALAVPSGQVQQTLLLDSDIRDWVVLPLLVIMIAAGMLRHFVGIIMKGAPKPIPKVEQRAKHLIRRSQLLRGGSSNFIATSKLEARRAYLADKNVGYLREEADWAAEEAENSPSSAAGGMDPMNPMAAMDGMKGNMVFMVQNMIMMQGISHFFRGFILLKVPFPLTRGFKMMFQRGISDHMSNLDTSYVSSVSWYFLVMYGLRGFFRMVIGNPTQEQLESQTMLSQDLGMSPASGAPPAQYDAPQQLKSEADNLELVTKHKSALEDVEKRLLGRKYPKKKVTAKHDLYGYGTVTSAKSKKRN